MYSAISISLCVLSMLIFILVKIKLGGKRGVVAKGVASLMFVLGAVVAIVTNNLPFYAYIFLGGLVFGLVGDILLGIYEIDLEKPKKLYLNLGMLFFGLTQFCYIVGLSYHALNELDSVLVPLLLAAGIGIILALLILVNAPTFKLKFGDFTWQSLGYSSLICTCFVYSMFLTFLTVFTWSAFVAMALFLASDLILSYMYFGGKSGIKWDIANKITYYLAQTMFVVYLFFFIF